MNTIEDLNKSCIYYSIMLLQGIDSLSENAMRYRMKEIGENLIERSKE